MLRFGTGTTARSFDEYARWLDVAEGSGFDLLTCGDSQSLWAECFSMMMFAACHTTAPDLAITVSNPMTRHPAVTASACASVQQVAEGRFRYGISSGDSALRNIGVSPANVATIEAYATCVKIMTAGGQASWDGAPQTLHWLDRPTPTPVWIAAEGPRTQRMAGRIADGVVLSNSLTPERLSIAMENLALGAADAGRDVDDIEIWHMCNLLFAPTEEEGIHRSVPCSPGPPTTSSVSPSRARVYLTNSSNRCGGSCRTTSPGTMPSPAGTTPTTTSSTTTDCASGWPDREPSPAHPNAASSDSAKSPDTESAT